jgi:hypothetical protein
MEPIIHDATLAWIVGVMIVFFGVMIGNFLK